jgi:hypothetical protein
LSPPRNAQIMVGQRLRCGRLRMLLECEEREREREQLPMFSAKHQCLHQQYSKCNFHVQVPTLCFTTIATAGAPAPPTTWRRGKSISRSLLLRVCVHPQFDFTHRQLLQYVALLPRVLGIETEAALREHGNCKLLLLFLSLC